MTNKPQIELGDILTFGNDPQRYKCTHIEYDEDSGIRMFQIMPVDEHGNLIIKLSPDFKMTVKMCS